MFCLEFLVEIFDFWFKDLGFEIFECKLDGEGGKDFMFLVFGDDGFDMGFIWIFKVFFMLGDFLVEFLFILFVRDWFMFIGVGLFVLFILEFEEDGWVVNMCLVNCEIMFFSVFEIWWVGFILVNIGGLFVIVVFFVVSLERFFVEIRDGVELEFLIGFVEFFGLFCLLGFFGWIGLDVLCLLWGGRFVFWEFKCKFIFWSVEIFLLLIFVLFVNIIIFILFFFVE